MDKLIWYLMESSVLLACLYALYVLILRKETFFSLNRFYLIGIVCFSLAIPLLSFDFNPSPAAQLPIQQISQTRTQYYDAFAEWTHVSVQSSTIATADSSNWFSDINWTQIVLWGLAGVYLIGVVVCLSRTIWTVQWIYGLIQRHSKEIHERVTIVKVKNPMAPFSFLNYVFVHEEMIGTVEFDHILAHERTHVQQRHSVDLIFVQLLAAFFWFNPVIWQLIKSLKTTHEYIADNNILNEGYSLVEYQTLLLRQLISNNSYGLVHNFNLSFIKKRITMMTNKKSGVLGKVKVALALIFTAGFSMAMIQCNSAAEDQTPIVSEKSNSNNFSEGVNLPVITGREGAYYATASDLLNFTVKNDRLTIDGVEHEVDEIAEVISNSGLTTNGIIALRVDASQKMKMIRDIQTELRKVNRRKVLQIGQSALGQMVESAMLLPPLKGQNLPGVPEMPHIDDAYAKEHDIDILKIFLGKHADLKYHQMVYDFVKDQMAKGKSNYVVSTKYSDADSYGTYLQNWVYIQEGFNQIYQERSQSMFGKNFLELNKDDLEEKAQYDAIRKGIPRAISLAEPEGC